MKMCVHTKSYTGMFVAVLLITARQWKQTVYPSTDDSVHKMRSIHTMEYDLALQSNETLPHAVTSTTFNA